MYLSCITALFLAAKTVESSRERISEYTVQKQMFFITDSSVDPAPLLYEGPESNPLLLNNIKWMCAPTHAPDANGDGLFDSLVAHGLTYRPSEQVVNLEREGATIKGAWSSHGYSASWSDVAGYYDEYFVDFDDTTVWHFKGSSFNAWETYPPGRGGGLVSAGAGEWTFNTSHPKIVAMVEALGEAGMNLTSESCAEIYASVWTTANAKGDSTSAGTSTTGIKVVFLLLSSILLYLINF